MILKELIALNETKNLPYQARVGSGDWQDIQLPAASLEDIAEAVGASPVDEKAHAKFSLHFLTELVEGYIGEGPDGPGTSWNEMDFDVQSLKNDVLKIAYHFGGVNMRRAKTEGGYGEPVKKSGVITLMPGN